MIPSELVVATVSSRRGKIILRGKKGVERYAVDARGQRLADETAATLIQGERVIEPVPGANLVLTVDSELQHLAGARRRAYGRIRGRDRRAQDRQDPRDRQ